MFVKMPPNLIILKTLIIFLIVISLTQTAETEIIEGLQIKNTDTSNLLDVNFYLTLFSHGFLIDMCLISVIFFKGHRNYIENHKAFFYAFLLFLIIEIFLTHKTEFILINFQLNLILVISMLVQIFVGGWVTSILGKKNRGQNINLQKTMHKWIGYLQLIIIKGQLYFLLNQKLTGNTFLIILICCTLFNITLYSLFALCNKKSKTGPISIQRQYETMEFRDVVRSLQLNEFNPFEQYIPIKSITENESCSSERPQSEVQWFILENRVVSLREFNHPGGNFLLSKCGRKDLTKYLWGETSFLFLAKEKEQVLFFKHKHGKFMKDYVNRHTFGFHSEYLFQTKIKGESCCDFSQIEANQSLFAQRSFRTNGHALFEDINTKDFVLEYQVHFKDSPDKILFVSKSAKDGEVSFVDFSRYWPELIGKYILIDSTDNETSFTTVLLSMIPTYRNLRNAYILQTNHSFYNYTCKFITAELIKIDKINVQTRGHKKTSDICALFTNQARLPVNRAFRISELLGLGISHLTKSSEKILLLVKNEGILPFIDFFEMITQIYLLRNSNGSFTDWVFGREYLLLFGNNPRFVVEWIIEDHFLETAKSLGLYQLQILKEIQKQSGENQQKNLLESVFVVSDILDFAFYDNIKERKISGALAEQFVIQKAHLFEKIIVSGNDLWRRELFGTAKIPEDIFEKTFLI